MLAFFCNVLLALAVCFLLSSPSFSCLLSLVLSLASSSSSALLASCSCSLLASFLLAFFLCLLGILCFRLLLSLDFASTLAACNLFSDTLPLLSTGVGGCFQEMDEGPRRKGTFFKETLYSLNGSVLHTMVSCEQIP